MIQISSLWLNTEGQLDRLDEAVNERIAQLEMKGNTVIGVASIERYQGEKDGKTTINYVVHVVYDKPITK